MGRQGSINLIGNAESSGITAAVPQRVFLSHTSDLGKDSEPASFVAAAVRAVLRARHAVTDMAYFAARDSSPAAACRDMVAQCDVYVGIIGVQYGSPVRDRPDVSYTELEFEAAGEHGQPRLIFLVREDSTHLPRKRQPAGQRVRQGAFRGRLRDSGLTVVQVSAPAELELALYQALVELGPSPDAPARLAAAQALLSSMPTDVLPDRAPLPAGSRMPLAPNPLFVGRGDELMQFGAALRGGDTTVALGQVVASTGLGGLGKTQLAVELGHRYGRFFAGGVYWLSFASADEVSLQVAACTGPEFDSLSVEQRVRQVKDAWQSATPRLLVFDNCEEEALLEAWRPTSGGCRVLVTSRRSQWSPTLGVAALPLDVLPRPDSIALLRRYRPDLAADDPALNALAQELGDLPLALHLAGSYLNTYRAHVRPADYLHELQQSDVVQHASLLGAGLDDSISPTHHVQGVAQTFALCLSRLDREREVDRIAIALLARMACMAPGEPVPQDLANKTLGDVSPLRRADALGRLCGLGLIERTNSHVRVHRLLTHFVRQEGLDSEAQPAVDRVLVYLGRAALDGQLTGTALAAVIPHLTHASGLAAAVPDEGEICRSQHTDSLRAAQLARATGLALNAGADLCGAKQQFEQVLEIHERQLGPDHPETAMSLWDLAWVMRDQAELAAARPLFQRALQIQEQVLGPDHPDTTIGLVGLALVLQDCGETDPARGLFERAFYTRQRVLGPEHQRTAVSLYYLAQLLHAQGELTHARGMYERALAIRQRVLGPDHPDTAKSMAGLALLLQDQGEFAAARSLHERALEIRRRSLGLNHHHTAWSLGHLAYLLHAQGDPAAARTLFERALAIRERVLGPDHPDTVGTRRALEELEGEGDGAGAEG